MLKKLRLLGNSSLTVFCKAWLLCVMSGSAGLAAADDTEVFFGKASSSGETRPNVMFVLDTSGSMGGRDGGEETRLERMKEAVKRMINSDLDMNIGLMNYSGKRGGGPVLYPITTLTQVVCNSAEGDTDCADEAALADNVYRVDGSMGDVEELASNGSVSNGSNLELAVLEDSRQNRVGLRFDGVNLARGATILDARLEFVAQGNTSEGSNITIEIEDVADSDPYDYSNHTISSRTYDNGTSVDWSPDEWFDLSVYQTPDLAQQVQRIINKTDWCNGNALAFYLYGEDGMRKAYTHDRAINSGVDYMPKLRVIQDPATVVSEDNCSEGQGTFSTKISHGDDDVEQEKDDDDVGSGSVELDLRYDDGDDIETVGLRFREIKVPQGAVIEEAIIEFQSYRDRDGALSLDIYLEDDLEPKKYRDGEGPYDNRNYLSQVVSWNNMPTMDEDQDFDSPDLSDLVQVLISNPDWDPDNNDNGMAFHLVPTSGSGKRGFRSRNHTSSHQPNLVITYTDPGASSSSGSTAISAYAGTTTTTTTTSGPITVEVREEMIDVVDGLVATGYTPTIDAYYEAARYLRGESVVFGKTRGEENNSRRENFRVSHPESYTGGVLVRDPDCNDSNLTSQDCADEKITGNPVYISPMTGSCQANHIVLLSDGVTNYNSSQSMIRTMIDADSCTPTSDGDEVCATDLAEWLLDTDHSTGESGLADVQNITTHTIAFNLGGSGKEFLERVAAAGGGTSHEADTADELLDVFNDLVTTIVDVDTGFTAPATTVNQFNRLTHRDDLYFALFKPEDSVRWNGNIKRFRLGKSASGGGDVLIRDLEGEPAIDTTTGFFKDSSRSWWPEKDDDGNELTTADGNIVARGGVANQLLLDNITGVGNRRVFTWLSDSGRTITEPIDLTATAQKLHESNDGITAAILGITDVGEDDDERELYKTSLLQWARGVDVLDSDGDESTTDIRRSLGDPMHSRPVVVNYAPATSGGDTRSLIYVSTNEGYLHAFDTSNGQEQFAFIPYELLGNLNTYFTDESGFDRPYGLDGPISIWRNDVNENQVIDSGDSAYLFVGMRRGGKSYYALNITDPANPQLAWTIKGGTGGTTGFANLGQTWSRLTPVKMYINGQAEDVLVFGGGYDENQDRGSYNTDLEHTPDDEGNGIYIVRATTGELLWSGTGQVGGTSFFADMEYGFNGNIRTVDINRDGYVDQMYAADVGGQLWRFDAVQYHTTDSGDLFDGGVIASLSGTADADHRRFYNEPDVALIEGGGERFLSVSIGSGWRAHPLDEVTQDRFYMIRQYAVYEKPAGYGKLVDTTYSDILESDLINVTSSVDPEVNKYGWYLDFSHTGEKVLGTSVTFDNSVVFSTYIPTTQTSVCDAEIGSGRAYILDVTSGSPVFDLDDSLDPDTGASSAVLTLTDRSLELNRSGIPPDAVIMIGESSPDEPQILIGAEQLSTGIVNRTRRTFWSDEGEAGKIVVTSSDSDDSDTGDSGDDDNNN